MATANSDNLLRGLTKAQDERLRAVMGQVEHPTPPGTPIPVADPASADKHWAQLTAESSGKYQWKLQDFVQGAWQDYSPAVTSGADYTAMEANGATGLTGSRVLLEFKGYDASSKPVYLFAGSSRVIGKITGAAAGKYIYTGSSYSGPTADLDPATDFTDAYFGTLAASNDCLVIATPEIAVSASGHAITAAANKFSMYFIGEVIHVNADGTKVVAAQIFWSGC